MNGAVYEVLKAAGYIFVGVLIGFVLPAFIQMYKLYQLNYGKGYENGRQTYGALIRKADSELECKHTVGGSACRACVMKCRAILRRCQMNAL